MDYRKRLVNMPEHQIRSYLDRPGHYGLPHRFWFVDVEGATMTTQYGFMDADDLRRGRKKAPQMKGTTSRKEWPTPEKALRAAKKKFAQQIAKGYVESDAIKAFVLSEPKDDSEETKETHESYALVQNPDVAWIATYEWFCLPNLREVYSGTPHHSVTIVDDSAHVCPEVILGGTLTEAQARVLRPVMYTFDANRLALTAEQVRGAAKPIVDELVADNNLPKLPSDTAWWVAATKGNRNKRALPDGINIHRLPPLVVGEHKLDAAQRMTFVRALLRDGVTSPIVHAVVDHLSADHRHRLGVAALRLWAQSEGRKPYQGLLSLGAHLTPQLATQKLTANVLRWDGADFARAQSTVAVLAEIDTRDSAEVLARLLTEHSHAKVRQAAHEALSTMAANRGIPVDDFLDTLITTYGLTHDGTATYSYGDRAFVATVDSTGNLTARALDSDGLPIGKVLTGLPQPAVNDDAVTAAAARTAFRETRIEVRRLTKAQVKRYETLMLTGRVWGGEHFARHVAGHPIIGRALAGLVWEVRTKDGERILGRIDDAALVDIDDNPVPLTDTSVTILHAVDLSDTERTAWDELFRDYDITTPFLQVTRPTFDLPADQGDDVTLHEVPTQDVGSYALATFWRKHGWQRCGTHDQGWETERSIDFPQFDLYVLMKVSGLYGLDVYACEDEEVTISHLTAHPTDIAPANAAAAAEETAIAWSKVPALVVSEIRYQLDDLRDTERKTP